jgi:CRP/FNR family transcriptional regulator, cyclic AMP receptor protein
VAVAERVCVLREDPDLAGRLSAERLARAEPLSVAGVLRRDLGTWDGAQDAGQGRDGFGLYVVDGLLVRRVGLEHRYGAELLGPGDIVQPWRHDGEEATLPFSAHWRVLAPLRLAVLDFAWAARMAPFPEVAVELLGRAVVRSRQVAAMMAIVQHHRLDDRLRLFFWELADRYGRVRSDGVHLNIELTHELIGDMVSARRPSVTLALGRLEQEGHLRREGRGWMLLGEPPSMAELLAAAS